MALSSRTRVEESPRLAWVACLVIGNLRPRSGRWNALEHPEGRVPGLDPGQYGRVGGDGVVLGARVDVQFVHDTTRLEDVRQPPVGVERDDVVGVAMV